MALVECKECGKAISKSAKTCPNCGHTQKKRSSFGKLLGTCILGTFAVIAIAISLNPDAGAPPIPKTPEQIAAEQKAKLDNQRESYARIIAEREITSRLKAPASAKFSGVRDTQVGPLRGGTPDEWIVRGHVDSQNSFGATLRSNYQVIIEFEEGKYDSSRTKKADFL